MPTEVKEFVGKAAAGSCACVGANEKGIWPGVWLTTWVLKREEGFGFVSSLPDAVVAPGCTCDCVCACWYWE